MNDDFASARTQLEFDKILARVVRYTRSDPGRDLLLASRIETTTGAVAAELGRVSEMKQLVEEEGDLPLDGIHAIAKAAAKAAIDGATLPARELRDIMTTLAASRTARAYLAKRKDRFPTLWSMAEPLVQDKVLEYNIDRAVDENGTVRETASRELQSIRRAIADRYAHLRKRLEGILRDVSDLGFTQEEIITTREGRMVIPVKSEHKQRVPGFVHSASASGATVFIEPTETLELNNDIRNLQFEEQREIERILRDLTVQVGRQQSAIRSNLEILATLDCLQAKAKYSVETLGIEPAVSDQGPLQLVQARHPLLLAHHGRDATIPLDMTLGDGFRTLLISGPNAGGKSVAMKCAGLLTLMAQAGLHVPAAPGTSLRVVQSMFVEIGDAQSIESDLSTFSSHLRSLIRIAESADRHSLVLIDEIGSGTDPAEGGALAAAMMELLTRRGTLTIATTHQGMLKVFAHESDGMENGAMEFDQASLTPTYRFRAGIPGSSYAIEMANRLGFPEEVMRRARALLGDRQTKLETLLVELEAAVQRQRKDLEAVQAEKQRLAGMVRTYEAKTASLTADLREMKRKAVEEAAAIVDRANAAIERSVREIRERHADAETVRDARTEVKQLREELSRHAETVAPPPAEPETLAIGTPVRLRTGQDLGEIISVSDDGSSAIVVFGSVRMRLHVKDLVVAPTAPAPLRSALPDGGDVHVTADREIDLRGMSGDEAIPLIDRAIDRAVLAGLHRLDIIHGKGTGALRKRVTEFLSRDTRVRGFRLGEWNEGGSGVTVVDLGDS